MKNFITLLLICLSAAVYSQTEKKVEKNDEKINELNKRLDNLLGSSKTISGDSVEYKLDLLFKEIHSLKTEINSIKASVEEIKTNDGAPNSNKSGLDQLNSKIQDIENGEYYIVLASGRFKETVDRFVTRFQNTQKIKVVQNLKGTWYHVVVDQPQDMRSAIITTNAIRKKDIKDARWVTGRKLKNI